MSAVRRASVARSGTTLLSWWPSIGSVLILIQDRYTRSYRISLTSEEPHPLHLRRLLQRTMSHVYQLVTVALPGRLSPMAC